MFPVFVINNNVWEKWLLAGGNIHQIHFEEYMSASKQLNPGFEEIFAFRHYRLSKQLVQRYKGTYIARAQFGWNKR